MVRYYVYLVCGSTMCVSTCQVEFVLREPSCLILIPRSRTSVKRSSRTKKDSSLRTNFTRQVDTHTVLPQTKFICLNLD